MKTFLSKIACVVALILTFQSCDLLNKKEEVKPANSEYKIEMGAFTQLNSTTISTNGGTVSVNTGDLSGLKITVPIGAYTSSRQFIISTADASASEFGKYLKPLSPFIKVENGGGYANGILELKVPVELPAGHFPLAFYVDELNNSLEPVPINAYDASSVTITTRHFSSSTIAAGTGSFSNLRQKAGTPYANLIISSMAESVINNSTVIASGFKPGTDDWEFINYGSYMAPGGHCAGQNMAAMWYYFEKKPSDGKLFNKFNTVDKIQYENNVGYRFCSVIHSDLEWESSVVKIFDKIIDKNQSLDKYKWYAIAGAMLVTGEPQGVGIYLPDGNWPDGTPKYGGHDLICYQVDLKSGKLFISDPNTPGKSQEISILNNKFDPYIASYKGGKKGVPFPFVTYYAKTAYIDWEKIGKRWGEVLSKKIGLVAPNKFPEYSIWNNDVKLNEIKDSISVSNDTLKLVALSEETENFYSNRLQGKKAIGLYVFDENGNLLLKQDGTHKKFILLKSGATKIGLYIYAWRNNDVNDELYIDFKWIKVNYLPTLNITTTEPNEVPIKTEGVKNQSYTFIAKSRGASIKLAKAKFEWNFGDGTSTTLINIDSTIAHKFALDGNYTVKCTLYDNLTKISEGIVIAKISSVCPSSVTYLNRTYKTVTIGSQCWFKENLDAGNMIQGGQLATNNNIIEKYCYDNDPKNCTTYGGLYQANEAMAYVGIKGSQGICPPGWHIPTNAEFETLKAFVKDDGNALKAVGQGKGNGLGTNTSGFSALMSGGYCVYFDNLGQFTFFWTSDGVFINNGGTWSAANEFALSSEHNQFWKDDSSCRSSIRCIKY